MLEGGGSASAEPGNNTSDNSICYARYTVLNHLHEGTHLILKMLLDS